MTRKLRVIIPAAVLLALAAVWWALPSAHAPAPPAAPGASAVPPRITIAPRPPATAPASPIEAHVTESSLLLPLEVRLADIQPFVEAAVPKNFDQTLELGAYGPAKDVRAVLDLVRGDVTL